MFGPMHSLNKCLLSGLYWSLSVVSTHKEKATTGILGLQELDVCHGTGWTRRLSRKHFLFISHLHFSPSNSPNSSLTARWSSCCSGHVAERGSCCIRFQPCAQRLLFLGSNSKVPGKASDFLSLYQVPTLQPSTASREGPFTSMVNSSVKM